MSEEEKGFVIKDRRSLDEKGELKDKEPEETQEEKEPEEKKRRRPRKGRDTPSAGAQFYLPYLQSQLNGPLSSG